MSQLQTDSLHLKEGTWNTDPYNLTKVNQPALFLVKMIAELETNKKIRAQHKTATTNGNNSKVPVS